MHFFDRIPPPSLERREMQLTLLACAAIIVLAAGLVLFMYPVVFSANAAPPNRILLISFFGFCGLSVLLAGHLVERQITIRRLRTQIEEARKGASEALVRASADLLQALPNFDSFQDRLSMEYRRAASAKQPLTVFVISMEMRAAVSESNQGTSALGDAAKAISGKLREQDSIYVLSTGYFGIILPGLGLPVANRVSARLSEGLADVAGAAGRFTFRIQTIGYPEQASSAHDLELAVSGLLPEPALKAFVYQ
jgi:GGDEF domain-containing protein